MSINKQTNKESEKVHLSEYIETGGGESVWVQEFYIFSDVWWLKNVIILIKEKEK